MKNAVIALAAAAALALGTVSVPTKAEAGPHMVAWWWIPVAVVGGVVIGGAVARGAYAGPRAEVYFEPERCRIVRQRTAGGWREVEVCR